MLRIDINSRIGKLLKFLITQLFSGYLIDAKKISNTLLTNFSTELKKQIGFHWRRGNPSDKVAMVEEELDGSDIEGIGKLADFFLG